MKKSGEQKTQDADIIALFFARDDNAIPIFRSEYEKILKHLAAGLAPDPRDAEELLWEVYFALWETIPPKRPDNLLGYACTILRSRAISLIRKNGRIKRGGAVTELPLEECSEVVGEEHDMDQIMQNRLASEIIKNYLNTVSKRRHDVFLARFYFEQSIPEIAREYGIGKTTVNKEIAEIRKELKDIFEKEGYLL